MIYSVKLIISKLGLAYLFKLSFLLITELFVFHFQGNLLLSDSVQYITIKLSSLLFCFHYLFGSFFSHLFDQFQNFKREYFVVLIKGFLVNLYLQSLLNDFNCQFFEVLHSRIDLLHDLVLFKVSSNQHGNSIF